MRRLLFGLVIVMCLALSYVQQKVLLVTLGYEVEAFRRQKDDLLDQYRVLNYNVLILRSPVILSQRLARRDILLTPPQQIEVLNKSIEAHAVVAQPAELKLVKPHWLQNIVQFTARWLGNGSQAKAETVLEDRELRAGM